MSNIVTYASLRRQYGKGRIVDSHEPIKLTAQLHAVPLSAKQASHVLQKADLNVPPMGLMAMRFILTSMGANRNNQVFVESECQSPTVLNPLIGQAIDLDHLQSFDAICGEITGSEWVQATDDTPAAIRCTGVLFEDLYPTVAKKVRMGIGKWAAISMEAYPNPAELIGNYIVVHNPVFIGCALVRFPGCVDAQIEEVSPPTSAVLQSAVDMFSRSINR